MRAEREQAKTPCGNLKLCSGHEDGIEGAIHAVGQRRLERTRARQQKQRLVSRINRRRVEDLWQS